MFWWYCLLLNCVLQNQVLKCTQMQVSDCLSSWPNCSFFPVSPTYAQLKMEYCEKSTLRDTIDQGLYEDTSRLWRLFREILDGLAYIHEKVSKYDSYELSIISVMPLSVWVSSYCIHFRAFISKVHSLPFPLLVCSRGLEYFIINLNFIMNHFRFFPLSQKFDCL